MAGAKWLMSTPKNAAPGTTSTYTCEIIQHGHSHCATYWQQEVSRLPKSFFDLQTFSMVSFTLDILQPNV